MKRVLPIELLLPVLATAWALLRAAAADAETIRLWPGAAPGTEDWTIQERKFEVKTKDFGALPLVADVTVPTLSVVRPEAGKGNGTAVIVCPGGGFQFLSWAGEGMEVARWLADRGVTAGVLKYRVRMTNEARPADGVDTRTFEERLKAGEPKINLARADAVQAIRHLRANAAKFGIARDRVGLMGFSAGAMTTLSVVLKADAEDRPDFAATIYGAMEEAPVPKDAPPLFIVHTQVDALVPAAQATKMFQAWTAAGRPAELHLYQAGAHGFGIRRGGLPVDSWTDAFERWLRASQLLDRQTVALTTEAVGGQKAVGTWKLEFNPGNGDREMVLAVRLDGAGLAGEFGPAGKLAKVTSIAFQDGRLTFTTETKREGEISRATFSGQVDAGKIAGEATWEYRGTTGSFPFAGSRTTEK